MKQALLLLVFLGLVSGASISGKSKVFPDGLTFNVDSYIITHPNWTVVSAPDCYSDELCGYPTYRATGFNVAYGDGTNHKFCQCINDPAMTAAKAIEEFAKVPKILRKEVFGITLATQWYGSGAGSHNNEIRIYANLPIEVFIHEAAHSFDKKASLTTQWAAAVASDTCVPDHYAATDHQEAFAQAVTLWTYLVLSKQTTNVDFDCMKNQLNFIKAKIPVTEIDYMIKGTKGNCPAYVAGSGTGLTGIYSKDMFLTTEHARRIDPIIDFKWLGASPGVGNISGDAWSVQWRGKLLPPFGGEWNFTVRADDGVRLYIEDHKIIDAWSARFGAGEFTGRATLLKNAMVNIRLEYFQFSSVSAITLEWAHLCSARTIIPPSQLYPVPAPPGTPVISDGKGLNTTISSGLFTAPLVNIGNTLISLNDVNVRNARSIVWNGFIRPKYTEGVAFYVNYVGAVKLTIGGQVLVNTLQHPSDSFRVDSTDTIKMDATLSYPIILEYASPRTTLAIKLYWQGDYVVNHEVVPLAQLFVAAPPKITVAASASGSATPVSTGDSDSSANVVQYGIAMIFFFALIL